MPGDPTTSQVNVPETFETADYLDRSTQPAAPVKGALPAVPGYELLGELGRGGMGVVYLARQLSLDRKVALKMIRAGELAGPQERERFLAEASAIARLQHPGIVQVYEVGTFNGCPYFALEYIDGGSLASRLAGEPQPPRDAARLVAQVARAMQHAHERNVIHRDLKPANVLLAKSEIRNPKSERKTDGSVSDFGFGISDLEPKVTDFGIAKLTDADSGATATGAILGTPAYASPEQAGGLAREAGAPADIHALGVILYEMLTGRPPFLGATAMQTLEMVRDQEPVPPRSLQPGVPRDLDTVCLKCLHKTPARRYPSAGELADDLDRFLAGEPIRARPVGTIERMVKWARRRPAAAALVLVVLLALIAGGLGVWRYQRDLGEALDEAVAQKKRAEEKEQEAREKAALYRAELDNTQRSVFALQLTQVGGLRQRDPVRALELLADPERCPEPLRDFTWGHFHRQSRRQRWSIKAHPDRIYGMVFSADSKWLATTSFDQTIKLWETASGREVGSFPLGTGRAVHLALTKDGKTLAAGCVDGRILLLDVDGNRLRLRRTLPAEDAHDIYSLSFSPDGKSLAVGISKGVRIWNVLDGTVRKTLSVSSLGPVVAIWLPRYDSFLACATIDREIRVYEAMPSGAFMKKLDGHRNQVVALAASAEGGWLAGLDAAARTDVPSTLRIWSTATWQSRPALEVSSTAFGGLAAAPDGRWLATGGFDRSVHLIDASDNSLRLLLRGHPANIGTVAFSPDGRHVAAGCHDGSLVLWEPLAGRSADTILKDEGRFLAAAFAPDGKQLALVGAGTGAPGKEMWKTQIRLLDWPGGKPLSPERDVGAAYDAVYSPDGQTLAVSINASVQLFDRKGERGRLLRSHGGSLRRLAFSPDGSLLAAAGDAALVLWNLKSGDMRTLREGKNQAWGSVAFAPDGKTLAAGGGPSSPGKGPGELLLWDVESGEVRASLKGHDRRVVALAYSPDGRTLASGSWDRTVKLWNTADDSLRTTLQAHTDEVLALAISPDGKTLATAGQDRLIKLWDPERGQERATLAAHQDHVFGLAFHPDSKVLVSTGRDATVRIWLAD